MAPSFSKPDATGMRSLLSRRQWLQLSTVGALSASCSGWLEPLAAAAASGAAPDRRRSCIVLWMNGGPSQTDTFDLKPGHANGGPFKEISTAVPGIKISEHLPKIAAWTKHMAVIRSMDTREEEHGRATFLLHTGYSEQGAIQYPPLGALISKELGRDEAVLPNFVTIAPYRQFSTAAYEPGFLGPMHAPLRLGENVEALRFRNGGAGYEESLKMPFLKPPAETAPRADDRISLLQQVDQDFLSRCPGAAGRSHQAAYDRAVRLMRSEAGKAFDLETEPAKVREAYGRNLFGQGCLLARRLVERGVPFVEVAFNGADGIGQGGGIPWDTHQNNFQAVSQLSQILDSAWAKLMADLHDRGLLETTLIVWMGEFGRTPKINNGQGRDHYATAWSTVLAGGGIKGGQVIGDTGADGMKVEKRPVRAADFLATICLALEMDPKKMNISNTGRPISLADKAARPIEELLS